MAYDNLATGEDLLLYTLAHGGQSVDSADTYALLVKSAIHQAYWSILGWKEFPFARANAPKVVTTAAKLSPVVSSISGTTVTLSAAITASQAGKKFYLDGNQSAYRISAHTGSTATLTLDATYVETQTSGPATIYQDEYALATDVIVPHGPLWLRGQFEGTIDLIEEGEFRAHYGRNSGYTAGIVEAAAIIRYSTSAGDTSPLIQIAPWTEDQVNIEYEYADRDVLTFDGVAATDTPKVPREYRWLIAEWALWLLFRKKSDDSIAPTTENISAGLRMLEDRYCSRSSRPRFYTRPRYSLGAKS